MEKLEGSEKSETLEDVTSTQENNNCSSTLIESDVNETNVQLEAADSGLKPLSEIKQDTCIVLKAKDDSQEKDIVIENVFLRSKLKRACKLCDREYLTDSWYLRHLLQTHCRNHRIATTFLNNVPHSLQLLQKEKEEHGSGILAENVVDSLKKKKDEKLEVQNKQLAKVPLPSLYRRNKSLKKFSCCSDVSSTSHRKAASSKCRTVDGEKLLEFEDSLPLRQRMCSTPKCNPRLKRSKRSSSIQHTNNAHCERKFMKRKRSRSRKIDSPGGPRKVEVQAKMEQDSVKLELDSVKTEPDSIKMEPDSVKTESDSVKPEPDSIKTEPDSVKTEPVSVKTEPVVLNEQLHEESSYGDNAYANGSIMNGPRNCSSPQKKFQLEVPSYWTRSRQQQSVRKIIIKYQRIREKITGRYFLKKTENVQEENCDSKDITVKEECCDKLNENLLQHANACGSLYNNDKRLVVSLIRIEDLPSAELLKLVGGKPKYNESKTTFIKDEQDIGSPLNDDCENFGHSNDEEAVEEDTNSLWSNNINSTAGTECNCNTAVTRTQDDVKLSEEDPKTNVILNGLASLKLNSYEDVKTSATNKPKIDEKLLLLQKRLYENGSSSILILKHWLLNNNLQAEYSRLFGESNTKCSRDIVAVREWADTSSSNTSKCKNEDEKEIIERTVGLHSGNPDEKNQKDPSEETLPIHANFSCNRPLATSELSERSPEKPRRNKNTALRTRSSINFSGQVYIIPPEKGVKRQSPIIFSPGSLKKLKTENCLEYTSNTVAKSNTPADTNITNSEDRKTEEINLLSPEPLQCYLCDKNFNSQKALEEHMHFLHDTSSDEKLIKPDVGDYEKQEGTTIEEVEGSSKSQFDTSWTTYTTGGSTEDDRETDNDEVSYSELERSHNIARKNKKWRCKLCKESFELIRNYLRHKYFSHNDESVVHICDNCKEVLTSIAMVNIHMCTNVSTWKCGRCSLNFSDAISWTQHNMTNHVERIGPHVCDTCKSTFLTSAMLQRHKSTHYKTTDGVTNFLRSPSALADSNLFGYSSNAFNFNINGIKVEIDPSNGMLSSFPTIRGKMYGADQLYIEQVTCLSDLNYISSDMTSNSTHLSCDDEKQFKCKFCDFFALTKSRMKFHLGKEHNIKVEICQLCDDLYVADVDARHLRNRHIISDYSYVKDMSNITCCTADDYENDLVKLLGFKRLLTLYEYQKFDKVPEDQSFQCTVCSTEFSSSLNYRMHYLESHDMMCALCNIAFEYNFQALEHKIKAHLSINSYLWAIQKIIVSLLNFKKYGSTMEATILKFNEIVTRADGPCTAKEEKCEYAKTCGLPDEAKLFESATLTDLDELIGEDEGTELRKDRIVELPDTDDSSLLCLDNEYKVRTNSLLVLGNHMNSTENKFMHLSYTLDSTGMMGNDFRSEQQILGGDNNFVVIVTEDAMRTYQGNFKDLASLMCSASNTVSEDHVLNALPECSKNLN